MKKILFCLPILACLSCIRPQEQSINDADSRRCVTVSASLSKAAVEGEVKSVCTTAVEDFVEAYLFAFPGDGTGPLSLHVSGTTSFNWTLPRDVDLEIWALANPPDDDLKAQLESLLEKRDLTKQDLLNLPPFACSSPEELHRLQTDGRKLPMSAVVRARFESSRETLSIPLKRLFAKYALKLNFSRFTSAGWTVSAAGVRCVNSNGRVPYFYEGPGAGYAAASEDLVPSLDQHTDRDIGILNWTGADGVSTGTTWFYFPENCQGDIVAGDGSAARSWKTVYQDLGARVAACSYLAVNVSASKDGGPERRFTYRVYPGNEPSMNRNFDIVRNTFHTLTVTLIPDMETDSFRWTPTQELRVEPGGTIDIPFETTLESLAFSTDGNGLSFVENGDGTARFQAPSFARDGVIVHALGGSEGFEISDSVPVCISVRYSVKAVIPPGCSFFEPFRLSVSPYRNAWPANVNPSMLEVVSQAPDGQEAVEILSGPHHDAGGWYFKARCTGPRSAADPSETLLIRNVDGSTIGLVEIPDVTEVFDIPVIDRGGPSMTSDGRFVLPVNGADFADIQLQFENTDGNAFTIPSSNYDLACTDTAVDGLYVEKVDSALQVYLPCWEGIPGLQDFDQSQVSGESYLQSVSSALQLRSKTGYAFYAEGMTFLIPNPFVGFDAVPPHPQIVCGRKMEYASGWSVVTSPDRLLEWHIKKDRSRPSFTVSPILMSNLGYVEALSSYEAAPKTASGCVLPYDIVRIPCDGSTYGQIGFILEVENVRSGEKASACAAIVDVVRELEITADLRIHQRHYPLLSPNDDEAKIKVSASFFQMSALTPNVEMDFLKVTATAQTPVHPTKEEAESLGPFWVNYASSNGTHHYFCSGTHYIPPEGDGLSYELQWNPGPTAGYFNYRVVTLWNPPQFDFDVNGFRQKHPDAFPNMHVVPASGGMCRYLHVDDYTRIVFYWERWKSACTDSGKGWYLCDNEETESPRYASAYYKPLAPASQSYGRFFYGSPGQTGTDVDPVYGGDPFFIQSNSNTFETILDY